MENVSRESSEPMETVKLIPESRTAFCGKTKPASCANLDTNGTEMTTDASGSRRMTSRRIATGMTTSGHTSQIASLANQDIPSNGTKTAKIL